MGIARSSHVINPPSSISDHLYPDEMRQSSGGYWIVINWGHVILQATSILNINDHLADIVAALNKRINYPNWCSHNRLADIKYSFPKSSCHSTGILL